MSTGTPRRPRLPSFRALVLAPSLIVAVAVPATRADPVPTAPPAAIDDAFSNPVDIVAADWDEDGDLDLLAAGFDQNRIRLYRNQEFGWLQSTFPLLGPANALAVGDIDGDGSDDLLYALGDSSTGVVGVVLNRSSDLNVPIETSGLANPQCAVLGDLDLDGDLDAVTCEFGGGGVTWFENVDGDGETWTTRSVAAMPAPADAVAHDVDLDGDLDLVVMASSRLEWLENRLGTATPTWVRHTVDANVPAGSTVAVGDLDGDGDAEIVGGAINTPLLAWWKRQASVTDLWSRKVVQTTWGVADLAVADVDQDGDRDILASRWVSNAGDLRFFENVDGDASAFVQQDLGGGYDRLRGFTAADLDQDGDLDFPVAAGDSDRVDWIENRTVRSSVRFGVRSDAMPAELPVAFDLVDFDRDGDLDIVSYDDDGRLRVRDSIIDPGHLLQSTGATLNHPEGFQLADIDRDGDIDVVMALDQGLEWLQNPGSGGQFTRHTIDNLKTFEDILVFDLTGDGSPDVVGFDAATSRVRWWRSAGGGTSWTENQLSGTLTSFAGMTYGDLDGDGQPEVVIAGDGAVRAYFRIADPAFSTVTVDGAVDVSHLAAADFDDDGDVDVLGYDPALAGMLRWDNDGAAGGWAETPIDFLADLTDLEIVDIDRDGDLDVATAHDTLFGLLLDVGSADARGQALLLGTERIALGDVTGDGVRDLIALGTLDRLHQVVMDAGQVRPLLAGGPPVSPIELEPAAGGFATLVDLEVRHFGRPGDQEIALQRLELTFTDALGALLTDAEVRGLFTALRLERLDPDHGGGPSELVTFGGAALGNPVTLFVPPSAVDDSVPPPVDERTVSSGTFRLSGDLEVDAASVVGDFELVFEGGAEAVVAVDGEGNTLSVLRWIVLPIEFEVVVGDAIFVDDFESGDTGAWSATSQP